MTDAQFDITTGVPGAGAVLGISGEIDLANVEDLTSALLEAAGVADGPVVVDLTGVRFLGSAGIRALFTHALRHPTELVVPDDGVVASVVALSGLGQVARVSPACG
ncbi:MAG TPA: STAS domain-containing protein [Pseudonocardiaceae bacterium]